MQQCRKYLQNEKARLEALVIAFNNSNEEHVKIKQEAEDKVKMSYVNQATSKLELYYILYYF